jgi:hypothetical protein
VPEKVFVSGFPALPHGRTIENYLYIARQKLLHGKIDASTRLERWAIV